MNETGLTWNQLDFCSLSMYDEFGRVRPALETWLEA
jgi:hypothetical protein